jgi:hypothetical protein
LKGARKGRRGVFKRLASLGLLQNSSPIHRCPVHCVVIAKPIYDQWGRRLAIIGEVRQEATMADSSRAYTSDGNWRVLLSAWKTSLGFYNGIGANAKAQHWEERTVWLFFKKTDWFDKPVDAISVSATFEGILPSTEPGVAQRGAVQHNASEADIRYFAFGAGIKFEGGSIGPAGPGGAATLDVRAVRATGGATISGEAVQCGEVYKN